MIRPTRSLAPFMMRSRIDLYTADGWLNVPAVRSFMLKNGLPVLLCVGGRATGKTYGALQDARARALTGPKFAYMRRTQTQADLVRKDELSPFKRIDLDHNFYTRAAVITKQVSGFYDGDEGPLLGYCLALSTISNTRGMDFSDVTDLIYDEFIPEAHERPITGEADALLNCYETINRNRELQGRPPLLMQCYANANNLANPIFAGLGLVDIARKASAEGREMWTIPERGILLLFLDNSPISKAKADTALYRMTAGSSFAAMSLGNQFKDANDNTLGSAPLRELSPIVAVGEICIYRHKGSRRWYVNRHISGAPKTFDSGEVELQRFRSSHIWLWRAYLSKKVLFDTYSTELLFRQYFGA